MEKLLKIMNSSSWKWHIGLSNEACGEIGENIRYGLNMKRFENNLKLYLNTSNVTRLVFSPTMNAFSIKNFHEYKNPLLIYGNPGCGKSYLANELLKDTVLLRIDLNLLRGIQNSKEYILDRLKKRNVTLMFQNINEQRGLLIDDIHIFYKHDKVSYKSIIEFIEDKKYYGEFKYGKQNGRGILIFSDGTK